MEKFLNKLSPEDKKRFTHIEGREDLFETKVLSFLSEQSENNKREKKEILIVSRNPGSASALIPVIEILNENSELEVNAIVDGRAQEIFQKKFNTKDITPKDMVLATDAIIKTPDVLFISPSETEQGLETYATSTFNNTPIVLLEDYYGSSLELLRRLKQTERKLPEKICVMDEGAKKIILADFPELKDQIEVTGQPAFDRFALENTQEISEQVRKQLGLNDTEKIVTFMSSLEGVSFIRELAKSLSHSNKEDFKFVFRRHPRDNTTYEEYEKIFNEVGVSLLRTNNIETNDIGATSDLIITSTSTESLNAIYRRKSTLNIVDKKLDEYSSRTMPPTVELGVSIGISKASELSELLPVLLDKQSELNHKLKQNMEKYYPKDGKSAERIANIVKQIIEGK